ncbi:hypothetical protein CKF54_04010 [Psittacicella hinzii]|uniref:Uncharacterized protein n=1 Tax=Psittacicella hinzii TaxID=2028575 RepID=A0A3A1Y6D8_9GAMM|nr:hypothetical protein [Psittacicella hinzii]RIY32866.1 hypothetical protein CKF54_04010 [Psittacicella hinzii]
MFKLKDLTSTIASFTRASLVRTHIALCAVTLSGMALSGIAKGETNSEAGVNAPGSSLILEQTQVNPLISLRSLATGVPLNNQVLAGDDKYVWQISEVMPQGKTAGLTQFKVPGTARCLYTLQGRIISANCDPFDNGSLWQVIPTTLGGVQIKSVRAQMCLSAGTSYDDFTLAPCQEDERTLVPLKLLWVFAPAAVNATLVPPLPINE